jgi:hypothetical protein
MLNILGESLATGKFSFAGGDNPNLEESVETPPLASTTPRLSSPAESDTPELETREPRQSRDAGSAQSKRKRVTGLDIMEKMAEGMTAMAESMKPSNSSQSQPYRILQGTIDYNIQAEAQGKVQEETCLTDAGILYMIDRFTDPALARTYLSLKRDGLRVMFLRKQVEKEDGNYFMDWSED